LLARPTKSKRQTTSDRLSPQHAERRHSSRWRGHPHHGFVRGATGLGAEVKVISNDRIAGLDETEARADDPEPVGTTRAAFDLRNNLIFRRRAAENRRSPVDLIYQRYGRFTWAGLRPACALVLHLFLEYNGSEVWIGTLDMSGMIPLLEEIRAFEPGCGQTVSSSSRTSSVATFCAPESPDEKNHRQSKRSRY